MEKGWSLLDNETYPLIRIQALGWCPLLFIMYCINLVMPHGFHPMKVKYGDYSLSLVLF